MKIFELNEIAYFEFHRRWNEIYAIVGTSIDYFNAYKTDSRLLSEEYEKVDKNTRYQIYLLIILGILSKFYDWALIASILFFGWIFIYVGLNIYVRMLKKRWLKEDRDRITELALRFNTAMPFGMTLWDLERMNIEEAVGYQSPLLSFPTRVNAAWLNEVFSLDGDELKHSDGSPVFNEELTEWLEAVKEKLFDGIAKQSRSFHSNED